MLPPRHSVPLVWTSLFYRWLVLLSLSVFGNGFQDLCGSGDYTTALTAHRECFDVMIGTSFFHSERLQLKPDLVTRPMVSPTPPICLVQHGPLWREGAADFGGYIARMSHAFNTCPQSSSGVVSARCVCSRNVSKADERSVGCLLEVADGKKSNGTR